MMVIENKYEFEQLVYLKTDRQQEARIVVAIRVNPNGCLMYQLAIGEESFWHYEFEITPEKDFAIAL